MPQLLSMILPIALFVGALVALNRLHTEQEIVVCFASGMSRWRVISPAMRLAVIIALITLFINSWSRPWPSGPCASELFRVRTDLAASLVKEGEFTEPASGLTVYAQGSDQSGPLRNLFIHKPDGGDATFRRARGQDRQAQRPAGAGHAPRLAGILFEGGVLNYLSSTNTSLI